MASLKMTNEILQDVLAFKGLGAPGMTLQWLHMGIITFQTISNSNIFQQFAHANNKENTKVTHYWPFVKGIHHSLGKKCEWESYR